jgi:hypothetical protein
VLRTPGDATGAAQHSEATPSVDTCRAGAHLGLLGGDVARATNTVCETVAAAEDERARDSALALTNTAASPKVAAVHHCEVLQAGS